MESPDLTHSRSSARHRPPARIGLTETAAAEQAAHQPHRAAPKPRPRRRRLQAEALPRPRVGDGDAARGIIIPRDEKSCDAVTAGAPELIDFMIGDRPKGQVPMRGGLRWLDNESNTQSASPREAAEASAPSCSTRSRIRKRRSPSSAAASRSSPASATWSRPVPGPARSASLIRASGNVPNSGSNGCPTAARRTWV